MRASPRLVAALAAAAAACASPPVVDRAPGDGPGGGPAWADTVLVVQRGGALETCAAALSCPPADACTASPTLGAPDGERLELGPGDRLEVAFVCTALLDQGGASQDDFRIWADVPPGSRALVSAGADPSDFRLVDALTETDQPFDLARAGLDVARFVQVVHDGGDPIALDALEAF